MKVVGHGRAVTEEHYLKESRMADAESIYLMQERLRVASASSTPSTPSRPSILPSIPSPIPTRVSIDINEYRKNEADRRLLLAPHLSWGQLHPDKSLIFYYPNKFCSTNLLSIYL